jgi:hypothetical protein
MDVALGEVTFMCASTERVSQFWGELLGRRPAARPAGSFCIEPKASGGLQLNFQLGTPAAGGTQREHFDLWTDDLDGAVASALRLGGARIETESPCRGRVHAEFDVVPMTDPEGRHLCLVGVAAR